MQTPCDRCGTFAPRVMWMERAICEPCHQTIKPYESGSTRIGVVLAAVVETLPKVAGVGSLALVLACLPQMGVALLAPPPMR